MWQKYKANKGYKIHQANDEHYHRNYAKHGTKKKATKMPAVLVRI